MNISLALTMSLSLWHKGCFAIYVTRILHGVLQWNDLNFANAVLIKAICWLLPLFMDMISFHLEISILSFMLVVQELFVCELDQRQRIQTNN
jgi:hypothetical protein